MAKNFADAWREVQRGNVYQPDLFASSIYTTHPKRRGLTPQQKARRQITYHPQPSANVWPEYQNPQNHRYTHSPALAKVQHKNALAVFANAEYF